MGIAPTVAASDVGTSVAATGAVPNPVLDVPDLRGACALLQSVAAAEGAVRRTCEIARTQVARLWELRASCALAEMLWVRGETPVGHPVLGPILEEFSEPTEVPDLLRAKAILGAYDARRNA